VKRFFFLLFSLLLFACGDDRKTATVNQDQNNFIPDSTKQRLLKIIEGGWVKEEYISGLEKTNSPMANCIPGILEEMIFDISDLKGDTLVNDRGRTIYPLEKRFDIVFSKEQDEKVRMTLRDSVYGQMNDVCLDYSVEGNDTVLLMVYHAADTSASTRYCREFRKISTMDSVTLEPIEYAVNKKLFVGNWKMNGSTVSFAMNGTVKNFKSFTRYSIDIYDEHPGSSPDKITFYNGISSVTYLFTIVHNKIQLYDFTVSGEIFSRGKLVAELSRI
jgi:hypothetical protein